MLAQRRHPNTNDVGQTHSPEHGPIVALSVRPSLLKNDLWHRRTPTLSNQPNPILNAFQHANAILHLRRGSQHRGLSHAVVGLISCCSSCRLCDIAQRRLVGHATIRGRSAPGYSASAVPKSALLTTESPGPPVISESRAFATWFTDVPRNWRTASGTRPIPWIKTVRKVLRPTC